MRRRLSGLHHHPHHFAVAFFSLAPTCIINGFEANVTESSQIRDQVFPLKKAYESSIVSVYLRILIEETWIK